MKEMTLQGSQPFSNLDSLESRWAECDSQEVLIATVILNPIYKTVPFTNLPILNPTGIYALLCRIWKQFYGMHLLQHFVQNSKTTSTIEVPMKTCPIRPLKYGAKQKLM
jgi:hypothetical protein